CTCVAGYTGTNCETDIDDCNPNPCQNGAACTDGVDSYTCTCVAGYTGTNCETDIDDCNPNPCQNGAACTDGVDSYTCTCVAGYTGTNCETDIDDCNPNPCQNGATCTDGVDSYTCTCVAGYTGTNCETAKCPADWYFFRESCYFRSTKDLAWLEAEEDCIALGGHLVEITSEQENNFIKSNMLIGNSVWIGLNETVTENVFVWVSSGNTLGVYRNWATGQPNNFTNQDCVYMHHATGNWYDYYCSYVTYYICEKASMFA
ncbi:fibropellin-1-like, partial [Ruditapes philippinarum]|uniref:fibropellin-1-like n=1 Tax=Ruditapes philippinarum TaxID=129788 RepID=UPI00295BB519